MHDRPEPTGQSANKPIPSGKGQSRRETDDQATTEASTAEYTPSKEPATVQPHDLLRFGPEPLGTVPQPVAKPTDVLSWGEDAAQHAGTTPDVPLVKVEPIPASIAGYDILGILGRGGMGIVYKARQPGLNRIVALKMILTGGHAGESELIRFRQEAEAVARLQHPNIVQVYEVGEEEGLPFFSLEYLDGGSLAHKIQGNPQPPREAARLVRGIAEGMHCAHQLNIIHRDLKPSNVLLAKDGTPKITDFGIAKCLEQELGQTRSGAIVGTPSYMSPEQAEAKTREVGPVSDVYSLGAVLYELLTGRAPFRGTTLHDTLEQVRKQEPVPPTQLQPSVDRDLETICLKCLQKEPPRRYASAAALADDLRRYLAGEPILARPVTQSERFVKWVRRNPQIAEFSAAIILVLIAWGVTASVMAWNIKSQKDEIDDARQKAEHNWTLALANEKTAKANEKKAEDLAYTVRRKHTETMTRILSLTKQVQGRLGETGLAKQVGPELQGLRNDLLAMVQLQVLELAEDKSISPFSKTAAHSVFGDFYRQVGMGVLALREYQTAYSDVKQLVESQPENDVARANKSVMLLRLGNMALDLNGDPVTARRAFQMAHELRTGIAEHPCSGEYTPSQNRDALSFIELDLGKLDLSQGDAAAARIHFEKALEARRAWQQESNKWEAQSYLAEACMYMGIVVTHLDDAVGSTRHFQEALQLAEVVAAKNPKDSSFQSDLAEILGALGEVQMRRGEWQEAAKNLERSHELAQAAFKDASEDAAHKSLLALSHERLARVARKQQRQADLDKNNQEALKLREELAQIEPKNVNWQADLALALARYGKPAEAEKLANDLAGRKLSSVALLLQVARTYSLCIAAAPDADIKHAQLQIAHSVMQSVFSTGFKDEFLLRTDSELNPQLLDTRHQKSEN
jgi:serine/threonine-protein kinase